MHGGEIVGLAGVGGNGQSELMEALMGLRAPIDGQILLEDAGDITGLPPERRRGLGIAVIPADRAAHALAGALSIADNYAVGGLHTGRYGGAMRLRRRRMREDTAVAVAEFAVQGVRGMGQKAALLSGGNAQKLVLAREFARQPAPGAGAQPQPRPRHPCRRGRAAALAGGARAGGRGAFDQR